MNSTKRFKAFLKAENMSKSEFYRQTGISNGYLDKVKSLGADKIEQILNIFPQLNLYWLIKGVGTPRLEPNELEMVTTAHYYPLNSIQDENLLEEPIIKRLITEVAQQEIQNLESKIEHLSQQNDLLLQLLKEKDERIKLLNERYEL